MNHGTTKIFCTSIVLIASLLSVMILLYLIMIHYRSSAQYSGFDLSGEYMAKPMKSLDYTMYMPHPFLSGTCIFTDTNSRISIAQFGQTNILVVCRNADEESVTNRITMDGRHWRWGSNHLEYARLHITPNLGYGLFLGIVTFDERCSVEAIRTKDAVRPSLRVKLTNQGGGIAFLLGRCWSDPEDSSEVILTPIAEP